MTERTLWKAAREVVDDSAAPPVLVVPALTDEQIERWAKEADAPMTVSLRHQYKTWVFGLDKLRRFAILAVRPAEQDTARDALRRIERLDPDLLNYDHLVRAICRAAIAEGSAQ